MMTSFFLLLVLPSLTALLAALLAPLIRRFPHHTGGFLALLFFAGASCLLPAVFGEGEIRWSLPWVKDLDVALALRLTPFTAWFAFLVLFLGGCVQLFACAYFASHSRLPSLLVLLGLFTTSMLGVLWSDNFYLLFLFWEGTSLLSFLLVGFHNEKGISRDNASQALLVTMLGGASILAGFILLHQQTGSASLSALLQQSDFLPDTAAVILIMVGAMTKSAQWPFHFWLPNAMVGPTPVSSFLHSATMVKAGVFLLATLAPVLGSHPIWAPVLVTVGILTIVCALMQGLRADDLKAILASTTLAALGFLTVLTGFATTAALLGFVIFLTAHALYKAPLFLAAGNLEKRFGTRQLSELGGVARHLPLTGVAILISALSLIGLFPLPGFLAKEYLLKAALNESPALAILLALLSAGMLALACRILYALTTSGTPPQKPVPRGMTIATLVPALATLGLTIAMGVSDGFLGQAATSLGAAPDASYHFWYGWTPALSLSLGAIALSLGVTWVFKTPKPPQSAPLFDRVYDLLLTRLRSLASRIAALLRDGKLVTHLTIILGSIGLLSSISLDLHLWDHLPLHWPSDSFVFLGLTPLLAIATVVAARSQATVGLLVSLGFVGFIIALLFLWFSAPDLALTQLMAETLILFLLAGSLAKAKQSEVSEPIRLRFIIATLGGLLATALILKSMTLEWDHPVSDFHLRQSKPAAYGANVVNVILVDFRALDTFGEIIVLAIAAMGANAALGAARRRAPLPPAEYSSLLTTGSRVLLYFLVPAILWIFWRGHNAPGGGFIAALLASAGIGMNLLASRPRYTPIFMRRMSRRFLFAGLLLASVSTVLPLAFGKPFLTALWVHFDTLHLGSPLLFDLGVFFAVLGFCMNYLRHFHQRTP